MTPATLCPPRAGESASALSPPLPISLRRAGDARLVTLARTGSDAAFAELVHRYQAPLTRHCRRLVGPDLAQDAVGQAFLQAYVALRGSEDDVAFRPWLYRIAYHCAVDLLRKEPPAHEELDLQYDGVAQPPQLFEQKERIRALTAAARALPERQREAIVMRELEGRSYDEIAAVVGDSPSAVRQLIFRARMTLRSGLAAIAPFFRLSWLSPASEPLAAPVGGGLAIKAAVTIAAGALAIAPGTVAHAAHVHARPHAVAAHAAAASATPARDAVPTAFVVRATGAPRPHQAGAHGVARHTGRRHHAAPVAHAPAPVVRPVARAPIGPPPPAPPAATPHPPADPAPAAHPATPDPTATATVAQPGASSSSTSSTPTSSTSSSAPSPATASQPQASTTTSSASSSPADGPRFAAPGRATDPGAPGASASSPGHGGPGPSAAAPAPGRGPAPAPSARPAPGPRDHGPGGGRTARAADATPGA